MVKRPTATGDGANPDTMPIACMVSEAVIVMGPKYRGD
jgi:hypothetical protein